MEVLIGLGVIVLCLFSPVIFLFVLIKIVKEINTNRRGKISYSKAPQTPINPANLQDEKLLTLIGKYFIRKPKAVRVFNWFSNQPLFKETVSDLLEYKTYSSNIKADNKELWHEFIQDIDKLIELSSSEGFQLNKYQMISAMIDWLDKFKLGASYQIAENYLEYIASTQPSLELLAESLFLYEKKALQGVDDFVFTLHNLRYSDNLNDLLTPRLILLSSVLVVLCEKYNLKHNDSQRLNDIILKAYKKHESTKFKDFLDGKDTLSEKDFDSLDGVEFEQFLLELFEKQGYIVQTTPKTGDQGADLILLKGNKITIVQAKRYTGKVSNKAIQEVVAAIAYYKAYDAIVITNSQFTKGAIALAKANNIEVYDRTKLISLVKQVG